MEKIRVGILGYGLSGHIFHGAILGCMEQYQVVSVYTRNPERKLMAEKELPGVHVTESVEEILLDKAIDMVVICSPNIYHFDLAKAAMAQRKHVVMEKPFTITSNEAKSLIELSKAYGVMLTVYHNRRYDGDFKTVEHIYASGVLGDLVEFESHFDRFRPEFKEKAWREEAYPGSGILYDLGPHLMDQACALFGKPNEVYADIRAERGGLVDDAFEVILYYDHLKVTLKASTLVNADTPRFLLLGKKGSFVKYGLDVQEPQLKEGMRPGDEGFGKDASSRFGSLNTIIGHERIETFVGDYRDYYGMIYNHLLFDEFLAIRAEDGLTVIELIEAAILSNKEKRRITI